MDPYAPNETACRGRQRRLLDEMARQDAELAVLTNRESVQWLTGAYIRPPFAPVVSLEASGRLTLVLPERMLQLSAAADERLGYPAKLHSTNQDDQPAASAATLLPALGTIPKRVAVEWSSVTPHLTTPLTASGVEQFDIGPTIFKLRRRKDADELSMLRCANEANRAMYEHARKIVRPGVNELDVYNQLQSVAVHTLGETLTYFGQDFQAAARGG